MRVIRTKSDLKEGVAALIRSCRHLARVHALSGDPPLRRRGAGFKGLARIVVSQQVSIASATAIWGRLEAQAHPLTAVSFLELRVGDLRRAGLSTVKTATLRRLAAAVQGGTLDLGALTHAPEVVIHERLTALKGIGPWTADIYILFCLARADAWSSGDLALQLAVKDIFGLQDRPGETRMSAIAEAWRPWRGVAARMLWSYYALGRRTSAAPA